MSDNILRFVFSLADQALIDKSSIVVEDTDDLQSMKISLRLVKEVKQGPQVYPLFPGSLNPLVG